MILRVENGEHRGPFSQPYPFSAEEFKAHVPWVRIRPDFYTLEPILSGSSDEVHPSHFQDVLERHFDPDLVRQHWMLGTPILGGGMWGTGVKDVQQLLNWFPLSSFGFLGSHGFEISTYDVPGDAVLSGEYQVLFNLDRAKLVKKEPLWNAVLNVHEIS